ncbi:MAG TPA: ubiquinol-cytochrome c reductase iron-sulfur subunit [Tepidisphaeraceae bacterium]
MAGPEKESADSPPTKGEILDAGVLGDYSADDVYDKFRGDGFFIIRRGRQITALSSICTHKGCKLRVADDLSFFCKCHGSTFDRDGRVTKGPAKTDLRFLAVALDDQSHIRVNPDRYVNPSTGSK